MSENVFRIKFESDGNISSPPGVTPSPSVPPSASRPNRLLDELFGNVAPRPTPDYYQEKDPAGGWAARAAMRRTGMTRGANSNELTMLRQAQSKLLRDRQAAQRSAQRAAAKAKKDADLAMEQARKAADRDSQRRLAIGKRAVRRGTARAAQQAKSTAGLVGRVASRFAGAGVGGAQIGQAVGAMAGTDLAAAAGPVGIALLAIRQFNKQIEEGGNTIRKVMTDFGKIGSDSVKGNAVGGITTAFDSVASGADKLNEKFLGLNVPLTIVSESFKTLSTGMKVYDEVLNSVTSRGKELAKYDSRIATGAANAEVTKLLSDMKEANRLGDRYGALIQKQAAMEARLNEALLPLKEKVADFVDWAMPYIEKAVEIFIALLEQILKGVEKGSKIYELFVGGPLRVLTGQLDEISKNTKKDTDFSVLYDPFDNLLKKLDGLRITPPAPDPTGEAADRKLMLPIFG